MSHVAIFFFSDKVVMKLIVGGSVVKGSTSSSLLTKQQNLRNFLASDSPTVAGAFLQIAMLFIHCID